MIAFEPARRIRHELPHGSVIIVSSYPDLAYVEHAFRNGTQCYVFRGSAIVQLLETIQNVING